MTEFEYTPVQKVTIQQIIKLSYDEFVNRFAVQDSSDVPYWIDGIIFRHWGFLFSDQIVSDSLSGVQHWTVFQFAFCKKFPKIIKRSDSNIEVPVIDVSTTPVFIDLVKWLKTQPIWSGKNES